jgi:epsilon-lactone hydrolase
VVEPEVPVVHVPARDLRPPRSVSPQAGATLFVDPLVEAEGELPPASDLAGWTMITDLVDQGLADQFGALAVDGTFERRSIDGVTVHVATPAPVVGSASDRVFLDIHGGAFVFGAGDACAAFTRQTLARVHTTTWGVDYRMPPAHPYPAALDDCLAVYRSLLDERPPHAIVVGGTSAGGNLAAALMLRAAHEGLPRPAGLVLLSPEADLTESGDSFQTVLGVDNVLRQSLASTIALYADGHDLQDPYLSPLFGDVSVFPPTFLQTGTRDLFLSNAVRLHRRLRSVDVRAELHVFEAMPHGGFDGADPTPEDEDVGVEVRKFLAGLSG